MNRLALILLSLRTFAEGQESANYSSTNPAPTAAFFTLPFLPTLPAFYQPTILPTLAPFTPPTLPSLIMTFKSPVAVRSPLLEEMQEAIENSFNNVSTSLNNIAKDNQDKLNSIVKDNQDSLNSLVKSGQDNINIVARSNQESIAALHKLTQDTIDKIIVTPAPLDISQYTLTPLPAVLQSQSRDSKSDESDSEVTTMAPTAAPPSPKIESIRKVGRYYVENLTPQHVLDILAFKKPLLTPAVFAEPTRPPVQLSKIHILKRKSPAARADSGTSHESNEREHHGQLKRSERDPDDEGSMQQQQLSDAAAAVGHVPYPAASGSLQGVVKSTRLR